MVGCNTGENKGTVGSGIGVYGSQDGSGWGVYGSSTTGVADYFTSTSGYGLNVLTGKVGVGITSPSNALTVAGII